MSENATTIAKRTVSDEGVLSRRTESTGELAPTATMAEKQFEVQSAITVAKKFPRNEDTAFQKLMRACQRTSFAEEARYRFPRGKIKNDKGQWVPNYVEGPSVNMAREAARVWGNIQYGVKVLRDDDDARQISGWAWDMETNVRDSGEDEFLKLIQRKVWDGPDGARTSTTQWVKPDERDLRELTNRRGAILERNAILKLMPRDLIEDAMNQVCETLSKEATNDPEAARKKLILGFAQLNVTPDMLEEYLHHKLIECSPQELTDLRAMWKSINDGQVKWADYMAAAMDDDNKKKPENGGATKGAAKGTLNVDDLRAGTASPDAPKAETTKPATEADSKPTREAGEEDLTDEERQRVKLEELFDAIAGKESKAFASDTLENAKRDDGKLIGKRLPGKVRIEDLDAAIKALQEKCKQLGI